MKQFVSWFVSATAACGLAGCASTPHVTVLPPLGPAPTAQTSGRGEGFVQIYSARQRAVMTPNAEEFFWNNDFGRNDFLHRPAHTDYVIYTQDGIVLKRVRNAQDINDPRPAVITLPAGIYKIQAEAEDYNGVTFTALVPVVVEPGATTIAHLDQGWTPSGHYNSSDLVSLPNGRFAGWRAPAETLAHNPREVQ